LSIEHQSKLFMVLQNLFCKNQIIYFIYLCNLPSQQLLTRFISQRARQFITLLSTVAKRFNVVIRKLIVPATDFMTLKLPPDFAKQPTGRSTGRETYNLFAISQRYNRAE